MSDVQEGALDMDRRALIIVYILNTHTHIYRHTHIHTHTEKQGFSGLAYGER